MSPAAFVNQMRLNLKLHDTLTPKQIIESKEFLDIGFDLIRRRLEENYDDMNPEAVDIATKLQGFILIFLEYSNNFSMLKRLEQQI